jgi:hypothetical protein
LTKVEEASKQTSHLPTGFYKFLRVGRYLVPVIPQSAIRIPQSAIRMQPDIYLSTLRISEPVIALTGLGIALICGYACRRLLRRQETAPAYRWMIRFFALMTVSSVLGPFLGHAFTYWAGFPGKYACWIFSIFSLGALSQAAIEHARLFFPCCRIAC